MRHSTFIAVAAFAAACAQSTTQETNKTASTSKPAAAAASAPAAATAPAPAMAAFPEAPARGDDSGRKSKNGTLDAEIGGVQVRVQYGRPSVNGRAIFGDLIPYDKVWRTGADEATTITFGKDAMFGGQKVSRGTYALFTIPGAAGWKVVLNSQPKQWGAYKHDTSKDVLTADVAAQKHDNTEVLTFASAENALHMMWADVAVAIPVAAQ